MGRGGWVFFYKASICHLARANICDPQLAGQTLETHCSSFSLPPNGSPRFSLNCVRDRHSQRGYNFKGATP